MGWTRVADRGPEINQLVLLYGPQLGTQTGALTEPAGETVKSGRWLLRGGIFAHRYDLDAITHWMPLPEKPAG